MQLPLPEKWEMIRCAWCDGCRTWFGPQMTWEYINVGRWLQWMNHDILTIFSGPELSSGRPFPGLTNAAPPPRKVGNDQMCLMRWLWDLIQPPDVQWKYINVGRWIHWMNHDILTILNGPELTTGQPFPGLTNAAPTPCFRDQIG